VAFAQPDMIFLKGIVIGIRFMKLVFQL